MFYFPKGFQYLVPMWVMRMMFKYSIKVLGKWKFISSYKNNSSDATNNNNKQ
jgi:hypothetical protein